MGSEDPMSMDSYVTVTREVLSAIRVSREGMAYSEIIRMNREELEQHFPYSSLTFFQDEVVRNLYVGHDESVIPAWTNGENANKILQTYYKKCPLNQNDMKTKFNEAFPEDSPEKQNYNGIKNLLKLHANVGVKGAFHEFLSIGTAVANYLEAKSQLWEQTVAGIEQWRTKREEFSSYLDEPDATADEVNAKYASVGGALSQASTSLEKYLKFCIKKHRHLSHIDQLKAANYVEITATEDSLNDILETENALYSIRTTMRMKEFFKDLRIPSSNDREELTKFRRNALMAVIDARQQSPPVTPPRRDGSPRRRHSNQGERDADQESDKQKRIREHIERAADKELRESQILYDRFGDMTKPDKMYEGKVVVALSSLQDLLKETQREERSSPRTFNVYADINNPLSGEPLIKLLKEQIEQLTSLKLKLNDLDKKYLKTKEDRLKLIDSFKIKKIVKPDDFITWYSQYKEFCDAIFKDDLLDPEEDNIKQKLLTKLEATLPPDEVKKLEPWKTVGEKMERFISTYEKNTSFLVEKYIKDITKMKPPDNDERSSLKNIEVFLQRIESLFKLDCLYLVQREHLDLFPKKIFTNFTQRRYTEALSKFKNLEIDQQNKFLKTGDMTLLDQFLNIISNNHLLVSFSKNFLPGSSGDTSDRRQTISYQGAGTQLNVPTVNQVALMKTSLKRVEENLNQERLNSNMDKIFYFLMVFSTKEKETLNEKLSLLEIKKDIGNDKKDEEYQKPNNRNKFSKQRSGKQKTPSKTPTKKSVLLAKSGPPQQSKSGPESSNPPKDKTWNKAKGFKSNNLDKKQSQVPQRKIPWHTCPIGCRGKDGTIHKVKYGSAGFCANFLNMPLAKREMIVKDRPEILRCCLRAQNSPLGHQRGDRLNCRVKKCGACSRWGHATPLCRDPAAQQIKGKQQKSVKMTHRKQNEETDIDDEDEQLDPEEYDGQEQYDDHEEEYEVEEESEENDTNDESEYDDSDYEYDREDQQDKSEEDDRDESFFEPDYDPDLLINDDQLANNSSQQRVSLVRRQIRMVKVQKTETRTSPDKRKNPVRNCKRMDYLNLMYPPPLPAFRRVQTKPKKVNERWFIRAGTSKQNTSGTLDNNLSSTMLINKIVEKKIAEILEDTIPKDPVLDTLNECC